jgi:hypothetical protein
LIDPDETVVDVDVAVELEHELGELILSYVGAMPWGDLNQVGRRFCVVQDIDVIYKVVLFGDRDFDDIFSSDVLPGFEGSQDCFVGCSTVHYHMLAADQSLSQEVRDPHSWIWDRGVGVLEA